LLNSLLLGLDEPVLNDYFAMKVMNSLNLFISMLFIVEIIIRVTASGFIIGKYSYLKDGYNIFDFLVVSTICFTFVMDLIYDEEENNASLTELRDFATAIKALKALRPLRLAKSPALRDTGASLIASIPALFNSALINIFFIYIFGIIGVQTFCGKISTCANTLMKNKIDCIASGSEWILPPQNY
jgi:hypothetical protein